jgi:hypothetical protein
LGKQQKQYFNFFHQKNQQKTAKKQQEVQQKNQQKIENTPKKTAKNSKKQQKTAKKQQRFLEVATTKYKWNTGRFLAAKWKDFNVLW